MGLATARGTIDEEGVECALTRMLGNGETDGTGQFVRIALDEVLEGLLRIELGVQLLRRGGIERRRSLIGTPRLLDLRRTLTLNSSRHIVMRLDCDNAVIQLHTDTEDALEHLA